MKDPGHWSIFLNAALINNFVLAYFLGICPFFGVSARLETAVRMSGAVAFVMLVASACAFGINLILEAINAPYLRIISYILVISSTVQLVEMLMRKLSPPTFQGAGDLSAADYDELCNPRPRVVSDQSRLRLHAGDRLRVGCRSRIRAGARADGRRARETRPRERARTFQGNRGRTGRGRYSIHGFHGICGVGQMNLFVSVFISTVVISAMIALANHCVSSRLERAVKGQSLRQRLRRSQLALTDAVPTNSNLLLNPPLTGKQRKGVLPHAS